MDVNCAVILEVTLEEVGQLILNLFLKVASGRPTKSEQLGLAKQEVTPWQIGVAL